jgi:predicted metal-dependent phosphoesterase TrpH
VNAKLRFLRDAYGTLKEIERESLRAGLNGVAIVDHNTLEGAVKLFRYVKKRGIPLTVIIGEEIKTRSGDIIALDITDAIPSGLELAETLDLVRDANGMAIACHPCHRKGVGERNVLEQRFDAIETVNSSISGESNRKAKILAEKIGIARVGGSDAHWPEAIGRAYTVIHDSNLSHAIRHNLTEGVGSSMGRAVAIRQMLARLRYLRRFHASREENAQALDD